MRLQFSDDGTVLVRTGKVELGQGILTALTQIAAHELGIAPERVQVLAADTLHGPDEGVTSGSNSVHDAGAALRQACVQARERASGLRDAAAAPAVVGQSLPRVDLAAKLAGRPSYIHDLSPAGLLHGRVLHPPRPDSDLLAVDVAAVDGVPGLIGAYRDGRLLGVLCETSAQADRAIGLLAGAARWQADVPWTDEHDSLERLQQLPVKTHVVAEHGRRAESGVVRTLTARYSKPWIAHASIGTSCALARWDDQRAGAIRLHVWSHSQGIFNLRRDLALAFGIEPDAVRVQHVQGAGCYGHNGADDVAFDAAWLARRVPGRPVRVLWSRADELTRSPLGPAMVVELQADLDEHGRVVHWRHQVWSTGHSQRPGRSATPALLGCWQIEHAFAQPPAINMPLSSGGGAERNAIPGYDLARLAGVEPSGHRAAAAQLGAALARRAGQRVRGRELRRRDRRRDRRGPAGLAAPPPRTRSASARRARAGCDGSRLARALARRGCGPRHRLCPLQEHRCLVRGGGRGRGRCVAARAAPHGRGGRGAGDQPRRRARADRRRCDPGHQLGAEGSRAL